jgi:hypothetical protein
MPDIHIRIIPRSEQRYDTAGDYLEIPDGSWEVRISQMDVKREAAVLLHELYEAIATKLSGVPWGDIDAFDMEHGELNDPGLDPRAPYHRQHMDATDIERLVVEKLGMTWEEYDQAFEGGVDGA